MKDGTLLIILFGSRATGKTHGSSDVDIAVLSRHPLSLEEKDLLAERISREQGFREENIDIIDLSFASPLLQYEIARHGKLLHGDRFDFIRFRVRAWKRYLDTARFRRLRAETLQRTLYVK